MKKMKLLAILSIPFLLVSCNTSSKGSSKKSEVSAKEFVEKLASHISENEYFKGEGFKDSKEFNVELGGVEKTTLTTSEKTIQYEDTNYDIKVNFGLDVKNEVLRGQLDEVIVEGSKESKLNEIMYLQNDKTDGFVYVDTINKKYNKMSQASSFEEFIAYLNNTINSIDINSYIKKIVEDEKILEQFEKKSSLSISGSVYTAKLDKAEISIDDITDILKKISEYADIPYSGSVCLDGKVSLNTANGKESLKADLKITTDLTATKEMSASFGVSSEIEGAVKLQPGDKIKQTITMNGEASIKKLSKEIKPIDLTEYTKV